MRYLKVVQSHSKFLSLTRIFLYKQLLYKQGSTRQGKKLSNFSTGLKTAKREWSFGQIAN